MCYMADRIALGNASRQSRTGWRIDQEEMRTYSMAASSPFSFPFWASPGHSKMIRQLARVLGLRPEHFGAAVSELTHDDRPSQDWGAGAPQGPGASLVPRSSLTHTVGRMLRRAYAQHWAEQRRHSLSGGPQLVSLCRSRGSFCGSSKRASPCHKLVKLR